MRFRGVFDRGYCSAEVFDFPSKIATCPAEARTSVRSGGAYSKRIRPGRSISTRPSEVLPSALIWRNPASAVFKPLI
jgi:hypothetical protein